MANFDPAFDKTIRNEGGPLESTVMKREDGMSEYLNEPHEFVEDCDCRDCAIKQRDIAIWMLAEWCVAVDQNGTG